MKILWISILNVFLFVNLAGASLTITRIPVSKTGGSTPVLQDGSITDLGTAAGVGNVGIGSTNPGAVLDVTGTSRVNALVDSATISASNLVTNGSFGTGDFTGWVAGANWSVIGGVATHATGSTATLAQAITSTIGSTYKIVLTLSGASTVASITGTLGGQTFMTNYPDNVTAAYNFFITATSTAGLTFTPNTSFAGGITSVGVFLVNANWTPASIINDSTGNPNIEIRSSTNATPNISMGQNSMIYSTGATNNIAIGKNTLTRSIDDDMIAIGNGAMQYSSNMPGSIAIGENSLQNASSQHFAIGIGESAMGNAQVAAASDCIGYQCMFGTSGSFPLHDNSMGFKSLFGLTIGSYDTCLGSYSCYGVTSGGNNVIVGGTGGAQTQGNMNQSTIIGAVSGLVVNSASFNNLVGVGYHVFGANVSGLRDVALGAFAGNYETGNDALYINNVDQANTTQEKSTSLIYGKFSGSAGSTTGQFLDVNGNLGIGTTSPQNSLDVQGTINLKAFEITPAGNVGVGTVNPGQALDVKGTLRFTNSLINTTSSTGIGWSEHNATNQACNTTCGTSACVIGLDIGTVGVVNSGFVACTDATADDCICAGP